MAYFFRGKLLHLRGVDVGLSVIQAITEIKILPGCSSIPAAWHWDCFHNKKKSSEANTRGAHASVYGAEVA